MDVNANCICSRSIPFEKINALSLLADARLIKAKKLVIDYFNSRSEKTGHFQITEDQVFVVWFCKTLQHWKALVSTTVSDGVYYEITYNGDKHETYIDAYKKWENVRVGDDEYELSIERGLY